MLHFALFLGQMRFFHQKKKEIFLLMEELPQFANELTFQKESN